MAPGHVSRETWTGTMNGGLLVDWLEQFQEIGHGDHVRAVLTLVRLRPHGRGLSGDGLVCLSVHGASLCPCVAYLLILPHPGVGGMT